MAATSTQADDSPSPSRRSRLRRQLMSEVVDVARSHLATGGPSAVSWRGIAREVGVNPASLYTYFDSLDDLFTAVITTSFERLGAAVGAAAAGATELGPAERLMACAHAYRAWALDHPAEFNLIFTDRIPGYEAPPGGPTVEVQSMIFGPFVAALDDLTGAEPGGGAGPGSGAVGDPGDTARLHERVSLWAAMHGFVMLEINHHVPFVADHESAFDETLRRWLAILKRPGTD
jgi:AcrR family transcriptional regulator